MNLTSYSQNFEDVVLWRALKRVEHGFYVDVGAQHPVVDSVSRAFYEQGWRGIHIEPVPHWAALLRQDRPDETVLEVAIGERSGTLELNLIPDTGLSTAVGSYAERHLAERGFGHQTLRVPCLTLDDALRDLVAGREVHWLKIDVEGLEKAVLAGWNSATVRPWIIVVEATVPGTAEPDYADWEPLLLHADYVFAYFDGLNRFYVARENAALVRTLAVPPNVFDGVELSGTSTAAWSGLLNRKRREVEADAAARLDASERRVEEARRELEAERASAQAHARRLDDELRAARTRVQELNQTADRFRRAAEALQAELSRVYASRSWRITAPLRHAMWHGKRLAKPAVLASMRWAVRRARVRTVVLRILAPFPGLAARLRAMALHHGLIQSPAQVPFPMSTSAEADSFHPTGAAGGDAMPAQAARYYAQLARARASRAARNSGSC